MSVCLSAEKGCDVSEVTRALANEMAARANQQKTSTGCPP